MATLIKIENDAAAGSPVPDVEFRRLFPETSFPATLSAGDVADFGYALYEFVDRPPFSWNQKVVEGIPSQGADSVWRQTWDVVALQGDELQAAEDRHREVIKAQIVIATQARLDAFARERGYDDIKSASDYAGCTVPRFSTEGTYCRDARALTWEALYTMLAEVQAGTRPMPGGFADVVSDLPALAWPA